MTKVYSVQRQQKPQCRHSPQPPHTRCRVGLLEASTSCLIRTPVQLHLVSFVKSSAMTYQMSYSELRHHLAFNAVTRSLPEFSIRLYFVTVSLCRCVEVLLICGPQGEAVKMALEASGILKAEYLGPVKTLGYSSPLTGTSTANVLDSERGLI